MKARYLVIYNAFIINENALGRDCANENSLPRGMGVTAKGCIYSLIWYILVHTSLYSLEKCEAFSTRNIVYSLAYSYLCQQIDNVCL